MRCAECAGRGMAARPARPGEAGTELWGAGDFPGIACQGCGGTGIRTETPPRPPSAEEQLHTERQLLVFALRYNRLFPTETVEAWIESLDGLDVYAPEAGRAILAKLADGYDWAKRRHRPDGGALMAAFAQETAEIERMLALLAALMEHAALWIAAREGE